MLQWTISEPIWSAKSSSITPYFLFFLLLFYLFFCGAGAGARRL
jgi:hypothetical protein